MPSSESSPAGDRSRLRLSEVARHVVIPEGIVDTLWFDIEERCREFGDEFDAWQDGLGQAMFGLREDGLFAATVGGIGMSIPRQVAKTFIVGRAVVSLCTLYDGLTVLWTAHRLRTTTNTFQKLRSVVMRPAARPHVASGRNLGTAIRDANGEQEIPFRNGSRILFGAREQGFGRGFDEVDIEVFDEAQILTVRALEDMIAATNQTRFPHGALLFYMGTPPRPDDPGEAFTTRRDKALRAKDDAGAPDFSEPVASGNALYVECSADSNVGQPGGPSLDDLGQVSLANASYPHRTPPASVARLRENLPDDDAWRREGLGVWDEPEEMRELALPPDLWRLRTIDSKAVNTAPRMSAIGLEMDQSGRIWASPAVFAGDGSVHVELMPDDLLAEGIDRAIERLWSACRRRIPVVLPADSGASVLTAPMQAKGMRVYALNLREQAQASAGLVQSLKDESLTHLDDPVLEQSVRESGKTSMPGGQWRLARVGDLSSAPLLAVACARHGAVRWSRPPSNPNSDSPGRQVGSRAAGRRTAGRR